MLPPRSRSATVRRSRHGRRAARPRSASFRNRGIAVKSSRTRDFSPSSTCKSWRFGHYQDQRSLLRPSHTPMAAQIAISRSSRPGASISMRSPGVVGFLQIGACTVAMIKVGSSGCTTLQGVQHRTAIVARTPKAIAIGPTGSLRVLRATNGAYSHSHP